MKAFRILAERGRLCKTIIIFETSEAKARECAQYDGLTVLDIYEVEVKL